MVKCSIIVSKCVWYSLLSGKKIRCNGKKGKERLVSDGERGADKGSQRILFGWIFYGFIHAVILVLVIFAVFALPHIIIWFFRGVSWLLARLFP